MIGDLSKELDKLLLRIMQENNQPYTTGADIAHQAGYRIGTYAGVQRARQAIIDFHKRDDAKDKDL
jgi:hypothetical protein